MTTDELEFLISQHLDGDIAPADEARLQAALIADASARALFEEHRQVDAALKEVRSQDAVALAGIDWADMRASINASIDDANAGESIKLDDYRPAVANPFGRINRAMAVAAVVLVGLGVATVMLMRQKPTPEGPIAVTPPTTVPTNGTLADVGSKLSMVLAQVSGPSVESARQPTVASVSLGQPVGVPESALLSLMVAENNPKRVIVSPASSKPSNAEKNGRR
ncbi:MAG: hypothetical protein QM770_15325 [Tepidisphaeraceae bacterium]